MKLLSLYPFALLLADRGEPLPTGRSFKGDALRSGNAPAGRCCRPRSAWSARCR